jgi:glycosyltransferase involved in cell wall biosynthesis
MLPAYLPTCLPALRIAITTDWLTASGGAERVIAEMRKIFPFAPLFTTVLGEGCPEYLRHNVHSSRLQKLHCIFPDHRLLLPLLPKAVESWDLRGYDIVLSSSHAVAKGCIPPSTARHICYCHTPMRYIWEMEEKYLDDLGLFGPARSFVKWQFGKLRKWDRTTAKRVDLFIANSHTTQERIRRIYSRESIVLHPPVDDQFFQFPVRMSGAGLRTKDMGLGAHSPLSLVPSPYFLAVGRLVPYKRFDLLIEASRTLGFPLTIAGIGSDLPRLKRLAQGSGVTFLEHVPEDALPKLYSDATALLFPAHEDAGIVPLESQACGTPVIAFKKGGVLDTVLEGKTGIFFEKQTVAALKVALEKFRKTSFDPKFIREHARKFSSEKFRDKLQEIITS